MPRQFIWGCLLAGVALFALWKFQASFNEPPALFEPPVRSVEAAPLCPWREPELDQRRFFPSATRHVSETRILSGRRVELQKHLGRLPEPEENALLRHRIFAGSESIGFVLTRRVKGEHGAIELVLALNPRGEVAGVWLQRLREPEEIARELRNQAWLDLFRGRTHQRGWDGDDLSRMPEQARVSGGAVREAVRSLLILQAAAEGQLVNHYKEVACLLSFCSIQSRH